jgi:hypothetical protein
VARRAGLDRRRTAEGGVRWLNSTYIGIPTTQHTHVRNVWVLPTLAPPTIQEWCTPRHGPATSLNRYATSALVGTVGTTIPQTTSVWILTRLLCRTSHLRDEPITLLPWWWGSLVNAVQELRVLLRAGDEGEVRAHIGAHLDEIAAHFSRSAVDLQTGVDNAPDGELCARVRGALRDVVQEARKGRAEGVDAEASALGAMCVVGEYEVEVPTVALASVAGACGRGVVLVFAWRDEEVHVEAWRVAALLRIRRTAGARVVLREGRLWVRWCTGGLSFAHAGGLGAIEGRVENWAKDAPRVKTAQKQARGRAEREKWDKRGKVVIPIVDGR